MARLNPTTVLTYCGFVIFVLLYVKSSASVLLLVFSLGLILSLLGHTRQVKVVLVGGIPFALLVLLFNVAFAKYGQQVLFYIPFWFGKRPVYAEPALFGLISGLKILGMALTFVLINYYVEAYRLLSLTKGRFPQASLLLALSLRWLPALTTLFKVASELGRTRGLIKEQKKEHKLYLDMAKIMFVGSLEQVRDIAIALIARGYGTGLRTSYLELVWRPADVLILAGLLTTSAFFLWFPLPAQGSEEVGEMLRLSPFIISLMLPAFIEKGDGKWLY